MRQAARYTRGMNITRCIAVILTVALLAVLVQPARAEAMEPTTILLIAGAAVAVVLVIVVVIIANVRESQRGENPDSPVLVAQFVPLAAPQTP